MAGKSLLHYFKPKVAPPLPPPPPDTEVEVVAEAANESSNDSVLIEEDNTEVVTTKNSSPSRPVRRSTRASANRAREAWNDQYSSSDDDDDFIRGTRKRARNGSIATKQTTLGKNGTLICKKEQDKKYSKKKIKFDPEREAFLRSGVPDVIEKAKKKKSLENVKSDVDSEEEKIPEPKKKQLDAETIAFLHSGVPDSVLKAQQCVDKRKEENDFLTTMGFFPKTSHVCNLDLEAAAVRNGDSNSNEIDIKSLSPFRMIVPASEDEAVNFPIPFGGIPSSLDLTCLLSQESGIFTPVEICCGKNPVRVSSHETLQITRRSRAEPKSKDSSQNYERPWIDSMRVTNVKNLVVDKNALETLTRWLKQWKIDIKDDGGTSRKQEHKKKRGTTSDSDFLTSDEEESEMKKKSVLLTGPSGCAKTAAVYVLAKHFDFEVVEVNFSSKRPGKEVLQRVEEAVLSHRLKSSHNCLLLFKDIDLLHPEEDEGFFSAVAQLITTAVRPIVMTSSLPSYCLIDSKLDRKDPLRISFALPKPSEIVEKILKPILTSTNNHIESDEVDQVDRWLDSIVRHSGCDIRQCINQLQLLMSNFKNSSDITQLSDEDIHLHFSPFLPHLVDLNFPRQNLLPMIQSKEASQTSEEGEDELNLTVSARKKRIMRQLSSLGDGLELFGDLDFISRLSSSCPTRNVNIFGDIEEATWNWNHVSGVRSALFTRLASLLEGKEEVGVSTVDVKWVRELVLESDAEIDKWMEIDRINDEIGQYCDRSTTTGGIDWESCAAVRSIVKNNLLDSGAGRVQKRNGRMASYFNRLDKRLISKIQNTLGFQKSMDAVKLYC